MSLLQTSAIYLLLGTGAFAGALAAQQPTTIAGRVLDELTLEPIVEAEVDLVGAETRSPTGPGGEFLLEGVGVGTATLRVAAAGYTSTVETVEVTAGEIAYLQLYLLPIAAVLSEVQALIRQPDPGGATAEVDPERSPNALTAADLLMRQVPGLSASQGGALGTGTTLTIRGLNSITGSTLPAIYLDGTRINAESTNRTNLRSPPSLEVLSQIPASQIRRIRVLRGSSAAARYGDSANGVILIETRSDPE